MNVKVTHTVPLEEIEDEINSYLHQSKKRLDLIQNKLLEIVDSNNLFTKLEAIEEIREKLNFVDLKLQDSYNVIKGLISYRINSSEKENKDGNNVTEDRSSSKDSTE